MTLETDIDRQSDRQTGKEKKINENLLLPGWDGVSNEIRVRLRLRAIFDELSPHSITKWQLFDIKSK